MVEKAIWLDIALLYSPATCENMAAHSCNIQPYCLLNHQIIYIRMLACNHCSIFTYMQKNRMGYSISNQHKKNPYTLTYLNVVAG